MSSSGSSGSSLSSDWVRISKNSSSQSPPNSSPPGGAQPSPSRQPPPVAEQPVHAARRGSRARADARASMSEYHPRPDKRQPLPDADQPLPDKRQPLPDKRQPLPDKRQPLPDKRQPLPDKKGPPPAVHVGKVEIVFSFDTTSSMSRCLDQVRQKITEMVKRLQREIPGIRIAIIGHGDYCDGPNILTIMDFSNDEKQLCEFVKNIPATGGGDDPECYELVLNVVRERLSWTHGTKRSLVMIGDALPHPPTDPQNTWKLDWRVEAQKLYHILGVRIYAVQALNQPMSDPFYQALATLTGGNHLRLDDFSFIVDFLMAICFREQSIERLLAYEAEVRKRGSEVQPSVQKLFEELHSSYPEAAAGSRERIPQITRRMVELDDLLLRSQREEINEYERKLSQMQEELESRKEQGEEEWQDISKELSERQEGLERLADLLQNDQHQQLSEALDLSEEQPNEVREACVASEKQKVAASEMRASLTRHKQLTQCQSQARNVVSQLLNYEDHLHSHMAVLKERKEALEELESCGETYTKELMEYDEQLLQVQEKMQLAQNQMHSYKRNLQESTKQLEGGLDEIIKHDGALQQSRLELIYSIDRLEKLRKQRTDELSSLDQNFQKQKQLADAVRQMVQHHDDQLERKKSELQKFSKKAEENERTLERLKNTSQKSEAQLEQLKEAAAPFTQNPSTDDRAKSQSSSINAQVCKEQENVIEFLSVNVHPERLATELEIVGLINRDTREEAEVKTNTTRKRIRPVMKAALSKLELSEESDDTFKSVLKKLGALDGVLPIIT